MSFCNETPMIAKHRKGDGVVEVNRLAAIARLEYWTERNVVIKAARGTGHKAEKRRCCGFTLCA